MSVLADILTRIEALIEGSYAPAVRPIAAGTFEVVGDDHAVQQPLATTTAIPVYIELEREVEDPTVPSDVSGDYHWEAREIPIYVRYAYSPDDTGTARARTAADAEVTLKRVLLEPLNFCAGWARCQIVASRTPDEDNQGVQAIRWLVLTLTITYRESFA